MQITKGISVNNKVHIFPLVKRYSTGTNGKVSFEDIPSEELDKISEHYTKQLVAHFGNHGFPVDPLFVRDVRFLNEVMKSLLYRSVGKHHNIQTLIDDLFENSTNNEESEED